jgi:hypothetical protein
LDWQPVEANFSLETLFLKNRSLIVFIIILSAAASCKKSSNTPDPAPAPENKWSYADTSFNAGFSELNTRYSYQLGFRAAGAAGLAYGLMFQFAERPLAGAYTVTDTAIEAGQVAITLENGTPPAYISPGKGNSRLQATVSGGKLTFTGDNILVVRDTIPSLADTLNVSFNLTEF